MQLHKSTVEILKNFSAINSNLGIKKGEVLQTISPSKDIIASFTSEDTFDKDLAIFNLNEFLGVLSAFDKPDVELDDKLMTISQGKQKVNYTYADASLLILPPEKAIKFPVSDVSFTLTTAMFSQLQKMSAALSVEDLAVVGDGKTISLKVYDKKNPTGNKFELDTETSTSDEFTINFKMDKLKLFAGDYGVDISSKKISRFAHAGGKLTYLIAVEADSTFAV